MAGSQGLLVGILLGAAALTDMPFTPDKILRALGKV